MSLAVASSLEFQCMKNVQNIPIYSFISTKSICLLLCQFFANDCFFYFYFSLQVTYLPGGGGNSHKLNPDVCALLPNQTPDLSCCHSDQIRRISYLDIEQTPCRSLGDAPETAIDRSPSRGALRSPLLQRTCARSCTSVL